MLQYWWIGSVSTKADNCPSERERIINGSFLFVTFAYGIEYETVGTADAYALILEHLPFVDFLEEPTEVVPITIRINHCIDKPEFASTNESRIIAIVIYAAIVLILRTREDEVITAKLTICGIQYFCQRVHATFKRLAIVVQDITFEHDIYPLVVITDTDIALVFV